MQFTILDARENIQRTYSGSKQKWFKQAVNCWWQMSDIAGFLEGRNGWEDEEAFWDWVSVLCVNLNDAS